MDAASADSEGGTSDRRTVLVVEDDPDVRESIQTILKEEGLAVETAASGFEALQKANAHPPALVLLDLTLPDLEGERVSELLQMIGEGEVPVLVITGHSWAAERAVRVGAVDYLRKPFEMDDLLQAVHRVLGEG